METGFEGVEDELRVIEKVLKVVRRKGVSEDKILEIIRDPALDWYFSGSSGKEMLQRILREGE